ncbi:MAG: OsmC family protein [Bacteroidales bacterium]|nr:OsmC family protein [Bacteroidales bacterium]MDD4656019.1 OsmC family protein [Bacteroidales bacterium]
MTKMRTTYIGELKTEAIHLKSGSKVITEAPEDNNGKGQKFSPTDLFATSLGSCMLTIMGISAQAHGFSIEGTRVEVEKIMAANPRRVSEIKLEIHLPRKDYTDKEMRLIESAIKTCPVANSIHPDIVKTISYHLPE